MLSCGQLEAIREFDTCTIANAIEQFGLRLRSEGFTRPGLRCVTSDDARVLGYAVTSRIKSTDPPVMGGRFYDRTDWWEAISRVPAPRIAVIQDQDHEPGRGACCGEVHAAILKALRCEGLITNGSVRDLPAVRRLGFPMFAASVAVSHAYMHILDYGEPVEVFGLRVSTGDLLYADCHGAVSIPHDIAALLPEAAKRIRDRDQRIVEVCRSAEFSTERLLNVVRREES